MSRASLPTLRRLSSSNSNSNSNSSSGSSRPSSNQNLVGSIPSLSSSVSGKEVYRGVDAGENARRSRKEWLHGQLQARVLRREDAEQEKARACERVKEELWRPYAEDAEHTHELNIAWQHERGFFTWERVLVLTKRVPELEALRITGHPLHGLPLELAQSLHALTTLSLIANELESLPENIHELQPLTSLDLTKNRLRYLPDGLTQLTRLTHLNLSDNQLVALPDAFGQLTRLDRLWLDHNALVTLPDSISQCQQVHTAQINQNELTALPETLAQMSSLTSLSVNSNALTTLPEAITQLPRLQVLHAARNQLTALPRHMGALAHSLRELRLDWNAIKELPFSFRLLAGLRVLTMERNPLTMPPLDVVARGVAPTLAYITRAEDAFVLSSRRQVVEAFQATLAAAARFILANEPVPPFLVEARTDVDLLMACLEPEVHRSVPGAEAETLPFYAIVWDTFWRDGLPVLERLQVTEAEANAASSSSTPSHLQASASPVFSTQFTRDEVEDAVLHYADAFSTAALPDDALADFRRCLCTVPGDPTPVPDSNPSPNPNPKGQTSPSPPPSPAPATSPSSPPTQQRRVCVPGPHPYRCHRRARLIRVAMLTTEQAKDQLASEYVTRKLTRLKAKTRAKCVAFINSEQGVAHFEALAATLAGQLLVKRTALRKLDSKKNATTAALQKKRQALEAKVAALRKAKATRLTALENKLAVVTREHTALVNEEGANARAASGSSKNDKKIAKMEDVMARLREELEVPETVEDARILELELAMEGLETAQRSTEEEAKRTQKRIVDEHAGVEEEDSEEEDEEAEDEEEEDEEEESEDEEDEEGTDSDEEEGASKTTSKSMAPSENPEESEPSTKSFFQIEAPELQVEDYRVAATRVVEALLPEPVAGSAVVNREELVVLFQEHLRDAYVVDKCARVASRATFEFLQMRAVLQRWMGHGKRAVFDGWRVVARENRDTRAQALQARARKQLVDEQNHALELELQCLEARKWIQRIDMYTDAVYYEHSESGETSWTPPLHWEEVQGTHVPEKTNVRSDVRAGSPSWSGGTLPPI